MASSQSEVTNSINEFSLSIYKSNVKDKPAENAFMSPSSIFAVMAMIHLGAKGDTLAQMASVLKLDHVKSKNPHVSMKEFMKILKKENKDFTLSTANRLYTHSDKTILESYVKEVVNYFMADVKPMDFTTQADAARIEINKWVEEETKGKIRNLLAAGTVDSLTAMVVVNAIYFKGDWADKFDAKSTQKEKFYVDGKGSYAMVDMMRKKFKKVKFGKHAKLSCSVLELPYKGEEVSIIVLLPDKVDGLPSLEEELTSADLMDLASSQSLYPRLVEVSLPKFKLESSYTLNEVLSKLGMVDLFNPTKANLSGMSQEPLYVSLVAHKAFVDVNEEGTEAAAATAAVIKKRSIEIPEMFKADHPFLFMIWHKNMKVPLFIGRLAASPSDGPSSRDEL